MTFSVYGEYRIKIDNRVIVQRNTLTYNLREVLLGTTTKSSISRTQIKTLKLGNGNSEPKEDDTDLDSPIVSLNLTNTQSEELSKNFVSFSAQYTVPNDVWQEEVAELGVFNNNGVMYSRTKLREPIVMYSGSVITIEYTLRIALNENKENVLISGGDC